MHVKRQRSPWRRLIVAIIILFLLGVALLWAAAQYAMLDPDARIRIDFTQDEPVASGLKQLVMRKGDYMVQYCCEESTALVQRDDAEDGWVRRFTVSNTDQIVRSSYRAEARFLSNRLGDEVWYDGRIFVPAGWKPSEKVVVAMQWHGAKDFFVGEGGRSPPLEILIEGNEWVIHRAWDARPFSSGGKGNVQGQVTIASEPLKPGTWTRWTVHVRWSPTERGFVQVWQDGKKVADVKGPIAHRDLLGPYFKAGVYVPQWHYDGFEPDIPQRTLFFDHLAIAGGDDPFGVAGKE